MDLTEAEDTKKSKSERERQIPYDITYIWNLKYNTNEHIYKTNKLTDIKNRLAVANKEARTGISGLADVNNYV